MKTIPDHTATLTPEARAAAEQSVDNLRRAERAADILTAHCHRCGSEPDTVLTDLLADLMHWAHVNGQDFQTALEGAREYHNEETDNLRNP